MFTQLIEGVSPLPDDERISALIEKNSDPWDPPEPGGRFRIGILNAEGRLYRTLASDDWGNFVHMHLSLLNAGFVDQSPIGARVDGFDAVLRSK